MAKDRIEREELASKLLETAARGSDPLREMAEMMAAFLRHLQLQCSQTCVPAPVAIPVAVRRPLRAPFVRLRPDLLAHFGFHDAL